MNTLLTAMSLNKEVRIYIAQTTEIVEKARATHDLSPVSCAALGRTLTGAVMMGMMSKIDEEKVTLQIKGSNEIKLMVAIADSHGNVKGYTSDPLVETQINDRGKLAVGEAVGKEGEVIVIHDLGMKDPFIGRTSLVTGEIADDLTHYFAQSEQMSTAVGLGVLLNPKGFVQSAGGFIVQLLPEATEETIQRLEKNLEPIHSVTDMFESGMTIKAIADQIFNGLGLEEMETYPLNYTCNCSEEKMTDALIGLGANEIQAMIEENGEAELVCHFCNTAYHYDRANLESIIVSIQNL